MITLHNVLLLLMLIAFLLAAVGVSAPVNLTALGLFFWSLTLLLQALSQ